MTDVAWDAAGNTFISDGYINSRVAKVDKDGNWLKSWGERGNEPGQFNTPHSIAADAKGNVYVADRGNRRIQVFDGDGKFLRQITIDVPVPPRRQAGDRQHPERGADQGRHLRAGLAVGDLHHAGAEPGALQLRRLSRPHLQAHASTARCSACSARSGKQLKQFGWIHEIACPSENVLYVGELLNWRVQKLVLRP